MPFLDALREEEARELRALGTARRYRRGTALFHERQVSDRVLAVLRGHVKLSTVTEDGREVVLAIRSPGDLLGEQSALDRQPRSATATAVDQVEVLVVPASSFRSFLARHPRVALLLLEMLSGRLRDADRKRVEFAARDSVGRVASRLVELSERFGKAEREGVRIDLAITQDELAGWVGASRVAVSKALQTLRDLGWIETGRRSITVLDLEALRGRAA